MKQTRRSLSSKKRKSFNKGEKQHCYFLIDARCFLSCIKVVFYSLDKFATHIDAC